MYCSASSKNHVCALSLSRAGLCGRARARLRVIVNEVLSPFNTASGLHLWGGEAEAESLFLKAVRRVPDGLEKSAAGY